MATLTKIQLAALSVDQRLTLVGDIWDSLGDVEQTLPILEWHREILQKRLAAAELAPNASIRWKDARAKLVKKWLS